MIDEWEETTSGDSELGEEKAGGEQEDEVDEWGDDDLLSMEDSIVETLCTQVVKVTRATKDDKEVAKKIVTEKVKEVAKDQPKSERKTPMVGEFKKPITLEADYLYALQVEKEMEFSPTSGAGIGITSGTDWGSGKKKSTIDPFGQQEEKRATLSTSSSSTVREDSMIPSWASILFMTEDLSSLEILTKEMLVKIGGIDSGIFLRAMFDLVGQPPPAPKASTSWQIISTTVDRAHTFEVEIVEEWSTCSLQKCGADKKEEPATLALKVPSPDVLLKLLFGEPGKPRKSRFCFVPMSLEIQDGKEGHSATIVVDQGLQHVYLLDPNGATKFFGDLGESTVEYLMSRFVTIMNEHQDTVEAKKKFTWVSSSRWNTGSRSINPPDILFGGNCVMCTVLLIHLLQLLQEDVTTVFARLSQLSQFETEKFNYLLSTYSVVQSKRLFKL